MKAGIKAFVYIMAIIGLVGLCFQAGMYWWAPFAVIGAGILFSLCLCIAVYFWVILADGPADRVPK